jgi:hypothetical protein
MRISETYSALVTDAMRKAGSDIADNLMSATVSKAMGGIGGSKTWSEYLENPPQNLDLIEAYVENEIDSVTAIYLAMARAK